MAHASGKFAIAISDRSGLQFPYTEMVKEWTGAWVHTSEYEPKAPQLMPHEHIPDPQALEHPRPARIAPAGLISLPLNPFETYASASQVVNVHSPDHGRSTGDIVRFRDTMPVGGLASSVYNLSSGYTITKVDDNSYTFEATSTPTTSETGGGIVASAGPVTVTD